MPESDSLAERFEDHRAHLRAVAYRMLGSLSEADDAVQESWLRLSRADRSDVENLSAWLTTVVARVCLNVLRSRRTRREEPLPPYLPDPVVSRAEGVDPEQHALLADSVGLALQVVLDTLAPAERLAFVLHDMFGVPFEEIAPMVGRTPTAARQLASRARRRVRVSEPTPDTGLPHQREVVDAFFAAARDGDFEALLAVLDPDVVLRTDLSTKPAGARREFRGAQVVARGARAGAQPGRVAKPALVNGAAGAVVFADGAPFALMAFTVVRGKIVAIDAITDPERLRRIDLSAFND